jgi:hypothetical protein
VRLLEAFAKSARSQSRFSGLNIGENGGGLPKQPRANIVGQHESTGFGFLGCCGHAHKRESNGLHISASARTSGIIALDKSNVPDKYFQTGYWTRTLPSLEHNPAGFSAQNNEKNQFLRFFPDGGSCD